MRNRFVLACSFLFVSSALGVAGDEAKFEKKIQGSWEVEKAPNRLLTRLVVTKDDKGFWVEVWATRGLKDEMVQKAPLHMLRAGIGDKGPVERGLATWKEGAGDGEATLYATLRFNAGDFVLELSKVYREPKNANWFTSFALKKSTAASGPKGKIIDPVGNPMKGATIREQRKDPPKNFTNSIGMKFVWIPPGNFMMGSPVKEEKRDANEAQHKVTLTKGFYMSVYTVTQEEWQAVMGNNSSQFKGEKNLPVEKVSWDDCQEFSKKLREKEKKPYRLPTEAKWEYACRAGTTTPFHFGETISTEQANYNGTLTYGNGKIGKYREKTTPVGNFQANAWGLHDMHGNVFQWCQDWLGDYPQKDVVDPQGPDSGKVRVLRGGTWIYSPGSCRSACRYRTEPGERSDVVGFRVCFFVE